MKVDQPDSDEWRRKRAEELTANQPEPWYLRHASERRAANGTTPPRRTRAAEIAPSIEAPRAVAEDAIEAEPHRTAPAAERTPAPAKTAIASPVSAKTPTLATTVPPRVAPAQPAARGRFAQTSAVVAGLLFAAAAGWQVNDLLNPAQPISIVPAPRLDVIDDAATVQAAAPVATAVACDAPAVGDAVRAQVVAAVLSETSDPAWSDRIAAEAKMSVAPPRVTVSGADGSRVCATVVTMRPPGRQSAIDAPVTFTVASGPAGVTVAGLQGIVPMVRQLAQPPRPVVVPPAATIPAAPPSVVSTAAPPLLTAAKRTPALRRSVPAIVPQAREPAANLSATRDDPKPTTTPIVVAAGCADAISRAEAIVCATPALSRLDRQLDTTLDRIQAGGDATTIKKVIGGQSRFLARRDRCTSDDCLADRYTDRLDDIAKIEAKLAREAQRIRDLPPCRGFEAYRPTRPCRIKP